MLDAPRSVPVLGAILGDGAEPASIRQKAAQTLATIATDGARAELLKRLASAPDRLAVEIAAGLAASKAGAELLLGNISGGKASARLLRESIVVDRMRGLRLVNFEERLKQLTAGLPPGDDRLTRLIAQRREGFVRSKGNPAAGQKSFQKLCANCHRLANEGHKIGPELDGIGIRGLDRLLEDILDPNRNVDVAFRTTQITTADGRTFSGLLLRQEGAVIVLADQQGKEIRIAAGDIAERRIAPLSPMPANIADLFNETEFNDLMAFLLSQRPK